MKPKRLERLVLRVLKENGNLIPMQRLISIAHAKAHNTDVFLVRNTISRLIARGSLKLSADLSITPGE